MKISVRLCLSFGLIVLISLVVGGFAIVSMRNVRQQTGLLEKENIPEVVLANQIERNISTVLARLVDYSYTDDDILLISCQASLDAAKQHLQAARQYSATSTRRDKLTEPLRKMDDAIVLFEKMIGERTQLTEQLIQERAGADAAGTNALAICSAFLRTQVEAMSGEIMAGLEGDQLDLRLQRIDLVSRILDLSNQIIAARWTAQSLRDMAILAQADALFNTIDADMTALKKILDFEGDLKRLDSCRVSINAYRAAMKRMQEIWTAREELAQKQTVQADNILDLAKKLASLGLDDTTLASKSISKSMGVALVVILIAVVLGLVLGIILATTTTISITRPLALITKAAAIFKTGDFSAAIAYKSKNEIGQLADTFRDMAKAQSDKMRAASAVSRGDLSVNVELMSERDELGKALQAIVLALKNVIQRNEATCQAQKQGDIEARNELGGLDGEYGTLAAGVNAALDSIALPIVEGISMLNEYAEGNLAREMRTLPGKQMALTNGLRNVRTNLMALITDANVLVDASVTGKLSVRADASKHRGAYAEVIAGINTITETLVGHMSVTMRYLDDIAHGKALAKHTAKVRGDYEKTQASINTCVEVLNRLQVDALAMADAGAEGRLDQSVDVKAYEGSWQKIVSGLNGMMNAVRLPLDEVGRVLQSAAEGSLTMSVTGEYQGAFDQLKSNLNTTVGNLNDALTQVAEAVSQVNSGAEQISDAAQSLSQGATEQASSLEEITSSLAEIASQTKTNAENANQANSLAGNARKVAEKGSEQMKQMVESMESINASSSQIAKIIKVIDDIAFQTNLLALNAAVEAARAGRHGKGFAVVADEVRNLAGRSAKAAKETADLIESSGVKTQTGMQVANATAESFKEIVDGIVKTNDLVGEIAAASSEQAQGVSQVNIGLGQVDQVTQQNTANAEETASAAEELGSQSAHLQGLVAKFKLRNQSERKRPSSQAKPPVKGYAKALPKSAKTEDKGWGQTSVAINQQDVINLDDHEFGKY